MNCTICNKEFNNTKGLSVHLVKCHNYNNNDKKQYYDKYLKKDNEGECYFCGKESLFFDLTRGYHRICGSSDCLGKTRATGTYEFLMYKYNLSKDDAIKLMNEKAIKRGENIKKSFDEKLNINPNFHKEKSHQTKEYWIKKGYSESETEIKLKEIWNDIHKKTWDKRRNNPELYTNVNTTQIEYWIKNGYTKEESLNKLSERQKTFSLEKCIEKYGEIDGVNVWTERQKKWSAKIEKKYKNGEFVKFRKENYSEPELELFEKIITKSDIKTAFYGKNQFFRFFREIGKTFAYDFVFNNKVIEFNGDYWHCNPKHYPKNYFHKYLNMTADEVWKNNDIKIQSIKNLGFDVLIVWESDYNKNKEKIIDECIEFLKK